MCGVLCPGKFCPFRALHTSLCFLMSYATVSNFRFSQLSYRSVTVQESTQTTPRSRLLSQSLSFSSSLSPRPLSPARRRLRSASGRLAVLVVVLSPARIHRDWLLLLPPKPTRRSCLMLGVMSLRRLLTLRLLRLFASR